MTADDEGDDPVQHHPPPHRHDPVGLDPREDHRQPRRAPGCVAERGRRIVVERGEAARRQPGEEMGDGRRDHPAERVDRGLLRDLGARRPSGGPRWGRRRAPRGVAAARATTRSRSRIPRSRRRAGARPGFARAPGARRCGSPGPRGRRRRRPRTRRRTRRSRPCGRTRARSRSRRWPRSPQRGASTPPSAPRWRASPGRASLYACSPTRKRTHHAERHPLDRQHARRSPAGVRRRLRRPHRARHGRRRLHGLAPHGSPRRARRDRPRVRARELERSAEQHRAPPRAA